MARRGALSEEALAALGAERLAALLMELAEKDPSVRKRLVLAAAESGGTGGLVKAIDRRLAALAGSRGYIDWEKARAYASELDGLRSAIATALAPLDPGGAAERLEKLVRLAPRVLERVDDSSGRFGGLFEHAVRDLGATWSQIPHLDGGVLARQVFDLTDSDDHGICDGLIQAAAPALGEAGMAALTSLARAALAESSQPAPGKTQWRSSRLRGMLSQLADEQGDVDAYIAAQAATEGERQDVLGIADRLLDAGRAEEALDWLGRKTARAELRVVTYAEMAMGMNAGGGEFGVQWERENLRIRALEMLGRRPEAQAIRWRLFERTLKPEMLRSHLAGLPDFEDDAVLSRANGYVASHPSAAAALDFFILWPDLNLAAKLVEQRGAELDGRRYEILQPAADALADRHPAAAIMVNRIMIDSVLGRANSAAYAHAARNLRACADLAVQVDWERFPLQSHDEYLASLRTRHGRKIGFWSLVG